MFPVLRLQIKNKSLPGIRHECRHHAAVYVLSCEDLVFGNTKYEKKDRLVQFFVSTYLTIVHEHHNIFPELLSTYLKPTFLDFFSTLFLFRQGRLFVICSLNLSRNCFPIHSESLPFPPNISFLYIRCPNVSIRPAIEVLFKFLLLFCFQLLHI